MYAKQKALGQWNQLFNCDSQISLDSGETFRELLIDTASLKISAASPNFPSSHKHAPKFPSATAKNRQTVSFERKAQQQPVQTTGLVQWKTTS